MDGSYPTSWDGWVRMVVGSWENGRRFFWFGKGMDMESFFWMFFFRKIQDNYVVLQEFKF